MKLLKNFFIWIIISFGLLLSSNIAFWSLEVNSPNYSKTISDKEDISWVINSAWLNAIETIVRIFQFVLIILVVYAGFQMVMSMWTDDSKLSNAKRTLWYSIVWLIFITFPIQIYNAFFSSKDSNYFINLDIFKSVLINIQTAIQILIWWIAVFILVYEWIKMIIKAKNEDSIKKAKDRIRWLIIWLIFIWFIEIWKRFLQNWDINTITWPTGIFKTIANLLLYMAWPTAIFFISLAWYYYIFSNWNEDKTKKWKNIIINTAIWVIIMLWVYVLLNDISLLKI